MPEVFEGRSAVASNAAVEGPGCLSASVPGPQPVGGAVRSAGVRRR